MKSSKVSHDQLASYRKVLGNPYAYLDGDGSFDAIVILRAGGEAGKRSGSAVTLSTAETESGASIERLTESRNLLQDPYAYLTDDGTYGAIAADSNCDRLERVVEQRSRPKYATIEKEVRQLHAKIWRERNKLWPGNVPSDPVELLDPVVAIELAGFEYDLVESLGELGTHGGGGEVAGTIDRPRRRISISRRLGYDTHRFTAAHELGHALLHQHATMHRDRPLDGTQRPSMRREPMEIEADKFATYFLMPEKLVKARFRQKYGVSGAFALTDGTALAFGQDKIQDELRRCKTRRALARVLAKAERYNGYQIPSLAVQFGVSVETMAIRLEELRLIAE